MIRRLFHWLWPWSQRNLRRRLARALEWTRTDSARPRLHQFVAGLTARQRALFPATTELLVNRLVALELGQPHDPALAASLSLHPSPRAAYERATAALLSRLITRALAGRFGSVEQDEAFRLYLQFRRLSAEPVPEALELTARMARMRRVGIEATRAYVEYLLRLGSSQHPDAQTVLETLRICVGREQENLPEPLRQLAEQLIARARPTRRN
jgi:hypothetical protein